MPLVDYGSSDEESENDYKVNEKEVYEIQWKKPKSSEENGKVCADVNSFSSGELFSSLPKPKKTFSVFEDDNKLSKLLLNKNSLPLGKKESVKISVPSLSEFEDDAEQPATKKIKPSDKSVGLFSVLPPPKNTSLKQVKRNLLPHVVSKNQITKTVCKIGANNKIVKETEGDEDDDDTLVGSSFFGTSLTQKTSLSDISSKSDRNFLFEETYSNFSDFNNSCPKEFLSQVKNSNTDTIVNEDNHSRVCDFSETSTATQKDSVNDNPLELDEKALQILCGNKKKRQQMPMNIIDLSGEEVLPDSKEWLLKQFTEEKRVRSHSHKKNQGPSSQSRRKHQITYLAYQAKEQELELQNQWANNRMSRKQTQSKYGF